MKTLQNKIYSLQTLQTQVNKWKSQGEKVVFTNGVFDLIHQGHIAYLYDTAQCGSKLVIGLNADASVKTLAKGPARPIKDQESRALILAAMQFVDAVVIFNDSTPWDVIQKLEPSVLVKGGDYDPLEEDPASKKYIVGRDVVLSTGGEVKVIPFLPGFSTTAIEKKILAANQ